MKTFETFEQVGDMAPCMKRPIVIHAKKMNEEFRVNSLEGNYNSSAARYHDSWISKDRADMMKTADRIACIEIELPPLKP